LSNRNASIQQQSPNLIRHPDSLLNQSLTRTMDRLYVDLLDRAQWDWSHARKPNYFGDGLSIVEVGLL
jgi:hypothetical protein